MRNATLLGCGVLLVCACSGREQVRTDYVGTASMTQDQVLTLLNQDGYTEVTALHKNGPDWVGAANKDGQSVNFDIDKDGKIHSK